MATRRSKFGFRSFVVADTLGGLKEALGRGLASFPRARRQQQTALAFVCTGQGAQWAGMGIELVAFPVFAASIHHSQEVLTALGCQWDLAEEIRAHASTSRINRPDRSQPVCCALQIALIDLLSDWSITPKAVVGHSSGEVGRSCLVILWCTGADLLLKELHTQLDILPTKMRSELPTSVVYFRSVLLRMGRVEAC